MVNYRNSHFGWKIRHSLNLYRYSFWVVEKEVKWDSIEIWMNLLGGGVVVVVVGAKEKIEIVIRNEMNEITYDKLNQMILFDDKIDQQ